MNYAITPYSIEEIGRQGYGRITCKVVGYWSHDPITVYVDRRSYGADGGWKVTMSHSSGGRETKEVESDMDAEINFAAALKQMATIGKTLISLHGEAMESFYQDECAKRQAQHEAEQAAHQAKIDADLPIGDIAAAGIVAELAATAKEKSIVIRPFYRRGSDSVVRIEAQCYSKTVFRMRGTVVSKAEITAAIAKLSARTTAQST